MGVHFLECVSYIWMFSYKERPEGAGSKLIDLGMFLLSN